MNQVEFKFNLENEIRDICWIYGEYAFFQKFNYKVYYPSISEETKQLLISDPSDQKAINLLKKEFEPIFKSDAEVYEQHLEQVKDNWSKIEKDFFSSLEKCAQLKILNKYKSIISLYGPGGSFYEPDEISVRVAKDNQNDISRASETMAHEIIHLVINDLVKKYKLEFEDIERMVDLILTKTELSDLFANPKMQNLGNPLLDSVFEKNNHNVSKTVKEFSLLNK
jgi:hypothetical protein